MDTLAFLSLAGAAFLFAITPGPGTLAVLSRSVSHGFKPAIFLGLGEVLGDIMYLCIALLSLNILSETLAPIMDWVRLCGAAYLVYIGYKQYTSPAANVQSIKKAISPSKNILIGFLISGTNPKVIVFYLSFLPLFVDLSKINASDSALVVAVIFSMVWAGLALIAYMGTHLQRLMAEPKVAKWINRFTGGLMMGVGGAVATS